MIFLDDYMDFWCIFINNRYTWKKHLIALENLCRCAIFQFFTKPDDVLAENTMQLFSQSKDHMDCTENKMLSF